MIAWTDYDVGNHRLNCPACGRKPSDKTLGVTVEADGRAVAHCFRCNYVETYRRNHGAAYRPSKPAIRPVQAARHNTLSDYGCEQWSDSKPLFGAGVNYLKARRCAVPPADGDLRFHPSLKHPTGYIGPALVALVTDAATRRPMSLHRTWIQADGRKADVDPPRMLLGGHRKQGGVIRLWPEEFVTYGLAVAEGMETSLSLAHAYTPAWSCIDAGNLAALPVLVGIETLLIAADNDPAGIKAANDCAARWAAAGVEVLVTQQDENDINDALQEVA